MSESTPDVATQPGDELLLELADDYLHRYRAGEHPTEDEYVSKHPGLADRIRELFPAMIAMEQPGPGATADLAPPTERVGATVGRYKLLERIGEGGFGFVYMAEQQHPVRRKVALKVVKPGMDSRQVLARFDAERQALAIMDHPNIAKVFDAGATDSGRPYFVMELVKGEPITEFCDRSQLPPHERLELFGQVCQAVQHAHQKGIIHRDIKPTNVLVAMHDTTPVVKVIDFGVAKALGQELTDKTLFTGFAQFLGTPLYMSPEQAGQSSLDVDTRSDIYSLGVLLYELLTGTTPFDKERFKRAAQDEIRRIIREEEPPKPSTRLSESKEKLPSISAQRHMEPAKLTKLVRGELDWIVMKALEKDRTRRYETANGLAADVQRYLADEPVLACPPSTGYRLKKFARRNKGGLAVAALVLVFLVLLGSGVGWAVRDRTARHARVAGQVELILTEVEQLEREQKWPEALAAARRAEAVLAGGEADATTARRVREQLNDLEFIDQLEQIRMKKATWIGGKFDNAGAEREYARAFGGYGVAVDKLPVERSIERLKARPLLAVPLAAALDDWADAHWQQKFDAASSNLKRLVAVARGIDPEPLRDRVRSTGIKPAQEAGDELARLAESIDIRAQPPGTLENLASKLRRVKRSDSAVRLLRHAQSVYPGDFWINFHLAQRLADQNDYEGAVRFYTAALSIRPSAVAVRQNLGMALEAQQKLDEAIAAHRGSIELDPEFAAAYNSLGVVLRRQGKLDEADAALRKAIELAPQSRDAHNNLGVLLSDLQDHDQAIASYRRAIEVDPRFDGAYFNLGITLQHQGKVDEAIAAYRKVIELAPQHADAHNNLGCLLSDDLQDYDQAVACFRRAIELNPNFPRAYNSLGITLGRQKKLPEAVAAIRKAIELDPEFAPSYNDLGVALQNQGELDEAVAAFSKAIELDPKFAAAYYNLGMALQHQGKVDEAIAAYRKVIELAPQHADAHNNLGCLLSDDLQDYDQAVACFRRAIELNPNFPRAYSSLGITLERQKKLPEAVAAIRKAIELDQEFAPSYNALGVALQNQGELDEAVAAYRKAIELDPKSTAAYNNLGIALLNQGELDEAVAAFSKAIELDPKFAAAYNDLAWLLATCADAKLRDPSKALALATKAVELDPDNPNYLNTLGTAYYRSGDWKAAIAALEKSMELSEGGNSNDWFLLAMTHWQMGNKDEARQWYDRAVEWMERNGTANEELVRFGAEAAEVLGVNDEEQHEFPASAATSNSETPEK